MDHLGAFPQLLSAFKHLLNLSLLSLKTHGKNRSKRTLQGTPETGEKRSRYVQAPHNDFLISCISKIALFWNQVLLSKSINFI